MNSPYSIHSTFDALLSSTSTVWALSAMSPIFEILFQSGRLPIMRTSSRLLGQPMTSLSASNSATYTVTKTPVCHLTNSLVWHSSMFFATGWLQPNSYVNFSMLCRLRTPALPVHVIYLSKSFSIARISRCTISLASVMKLASIVTIFFFKRISSGRHLISAALQHHAHLSTKVTNGKDPDLQPTNIIL